MEITKNCSIETYYKALLVNRSKDFTADLIMKLDPSLEAKKGYLKNKTTSELVKILKKLEPTKKKLWILRDEIFKENLKELKKELEDIRHGVNELNQHAERRIK